MRLRRVACTCAPHTFAAAGKSGRGGHHSVRHSELPARRAGGPGDGQGPADMLPTCVRKEVAAS